MYRYSGERSVVHVANIEDMPVLFFPDGNVENLGLQSSDVPSFLFIGDCSDFMGFLPINMKNSLLALAKSFCRHYDEQDWKLFDKPYFDILSSASYLKSFYEDKNLEKNILNFNYLLSLANKMKAIYEKHEKGDFDFNFELSVAFGMLIAKEIPVEKIIQDIDIVYFAHQINQLDVGEFFSNKMVDYLKLFSGILHYQKEGKQNNGTGRIKFGYSLDEWLKEN